MKFTVVVIVLCLFALPAAARMLSVQEKLRQLDVDEALQQQIQLQQLQIEQYQNMNRRLPPTLVCEREYGDVLVCQAY